MMDQWEKISYMVQLIAACALFMIHSRKRENFVLRMALCSGAFVLLSYGVNSISEKRNFSIWIVLYWAAFLLVCAADVCLSGCACAADGVPCNLCLRYAARCV
ncbi:hypothetical protein C823_003973 [Eubacterium plexicaudatum ASF492]|nr:hypothetical protein C823_003973 [Eubacterium plexicaudatum ASF492]